LDSFCQRAPIARRIALGRDDCVFHGRGGHHLMNTCAGRGA
jgi:hypothetical protein